MKADQSSREFAPLGRRGHGTALELGEKMERGPQVWGSFLKRCYWWGFGATAFWWREIDEASCFWSGDSMGGKGNNCDGNGLVSAV